MAGVLSFKEFIGGADQIVLKQDFPSSSKNLVYNFGQDVTSWTFSADYQAIVVDTLTYNSITGEPNFSSSKVIGSFPKVEVTGGAVPAVTSAAAGLVRYTLPDGMYTGPLVPDARKNVVIVIVSNSWQTNDTPAQFSSHRFAIIQSYEPDVTIGDPTAESNYTAFNI